MKPPRDDLTPSDPHGTEPDGCGCGCLGFLLGMFLGGGALSALGALFSGCLAGCGYFSLLFLGVLAIALIFFPFQVWLLVALSPSIVLALQYFNQRNDPYYKTLVQRFCEKTGIKPSTDPALARVYSLLLWAIIQGAALAVMLLVFPRRS